MIDEEILYFSFVWIIISYITFMIIISENLDFSQKIYYIFIWLIFIPWIVKFAFYIVINSYYFLKWSKYYDEDYPVAMWFLIFFICMFVYMIYYKDNYKNENSQNYNYIENNYENNNYEKEYNYSIKWNVNFETWEKIYHLPWCENYVDTIIDENYWEKYFNTEKEAINAWFRKAKNCNY